MQMCDGGGAVGIDEAAIPLRFGKFLTSDPGVLLFGILPPVVTAGAGATQGISSQAKLAKSRITPRLTAPMMENSENFRKVLKTEVKYGLPTERHQTNRNLKYDRSKSRPFLHSELQLSSAWVQKQCHHGP